MKFLFPKTQFKRQYTAFAGALLLLFPASCVSAAPQATSTELATTAKNVNSFAVKDEAEFFGLLDLQRPELAAVKTAVEARDWTAAKQAWAKHLETRTSPCWIWSHADRATIQKAFEEKFGGLNKSVAVADKTLNREFSAQGVTKTLEKHPKWIHGTGEWTNVLNRFNFYQAMGEAYWATGQDKYAEDYVLLLEDWIAKNPVPNEVIKSAHTRANPWRTLETGIRAQNWLNAMQLFMDAPAFDAEAKYQMTRSLVEHARRLYEHATAFEQGNWQVVECTGLASVGMMLPEARESAGWRERSFQYLVEKMRKEVYADGGHWELTPAYHVWVMNQFLDVALLAKRNGYEVPGLLTRHEKMYEFLGRLSRPDRHLPALGDSNSVSVAAQLGIGALLYKRPDFRFLATKDAQRDWLWLFGPDVAERYAKLPTKQPDFLSTLLPQSHYAAMRTGWGEDAKYFFFDAGPWGGAHNHQDRLQIEMYAGRRLLIDPGQYPYDRPLAAHFRTAQEHNVLLIDGDKQIEADPKVLAWQDAPNALFTAASIEDETFRHQRSVLWVKPNYWVIVDHVTAINAADAKPHEVTRLFHFPLSTTKIESNSVQTTFAEGTNLQIQNIGAGALQMREDWIPTGGANAEKAPVAAYVNQGALPMTLVTVLTPFGNAKALPKVEALPGTDAVTHLQLSFADGQRDEIALAALPTTLKIGTHQTIGHALIVRRGAQGESVTAMQ